MKNDFTIDTLGCMDDVELRAICREYPNGNQWQHRKAFNYAATRLANIQGLRVTQPELSNVTTNQCEKQIQASMNC